MGDSRSAYYDALEEAEYEANRIRTANLSVNTNNSLFLLLMENLVKKKGNKL